ncbi:hypothetical protein ACFX1S_034846 [Malus domestica]
MITFRSLIKRLLVYGKEKKQERESSSEEENEWSREASSSQMNKEDCFRKELEAAIHMAECIYDLDGPEELPESLELVEFLCAKPDKPAPEVEDPLETIDLGMEDDPRPIQISGLLKTEDRAGIVNLLHEFKDCFALHCWKCALKPIM